MDIVHLSWEVFVIKQGQKIGNYYNNLVKSMKVALAVMGKKSIKDIDITFTINSTSKAN